MNGTTDNLGWINRALARDESTAIHLVVFSNIGNVSEQGSGIDQRSLLIPLSLVCLF